MIVEPAPQFGASGSFLAAPLSINFNNDLSHQIIVEGTWQGDRKRALSLHLDNYNNNFALTITTGSSTVKVPAYSDGYVNLRGFDAITIVSDGASIVPAFLTTQENPTGFTARGNPPNTSAGGPLTFVGSVNLTTNNPAIYCAYDPVSGNVFVVTSSGLIVAIDPIKMAIVSIFNISGMANNNIIQAACYAPDRIVVSCPSGSGSQYAVYTISTGAFVVYPGVGGVAPTDDITYHPGDNNFYFVRRLSGTCVFRSLFNNAASINGTPVNTTAYDCSSGLAKIYYNAFDQKVYVGNTPIGTVPFQTNDLYRYNSALVEESTSIDNSALTTGFTMCAGPSNNLYVASSSNGLYRLKITGAGFYTGVIKKITLSGSAYGMAYNPGTSNLYIGGGNHDVVNTGLDGIIGLMPAYTGGGAGVRLCYADNVGMICFVTNQGMVYFGK